MRRSIVVASLALLATATGCAPGYGYGHSCGYGYPHGGEGAVLAFVRLGVAIAEISELSARREAREADEAAFEASQATPVYVPYVPPPPPRETAPDPAHVAFDATAASAALRDRDVSACVAKGAPRGYGHARVRFDPDGHVAQVTIDAPQGMTTDAVRCLGNALGGAQVPEFDGGAMNVGTTFLVK